MPLIKTIPPKEATGELAELYAKITEVRGAVMNSHMLFSVSPELLKQQLAFIGYYVNHQTLSQALLACIRMLVSERSGCTFCINFNEGMLINKLGWSTEQTRNSKQDPSSAPLDDKEKAILLFVLKAVANPHGITSDDLEPLRTFGYADSDILDALNHGARMVAVDILFDTFKIETPS